MTPIERGAKGVRRFMRGLGFVTPPTTARSTARHVLDAAVDVDELARVLRAADLDVYERQCRGVEVDSWEGVCARAIRAHLLGVDQ